MCSINRELNWGKLFGLFKCTLRASNRGEQNTGGTTTKGFLNELIAGTAETLEGYGTKLAL